MHKKTLGERVIVLNINYLSLGIPQQVFLYPNSTGLFRFTNYENERFSITVENWG